MNRRKGPALGAAAVVGAVVVGILIAVMVHLREQDQFERAQDEAAGRAAEQAESVAALSLSQLSTAVAFFEGSQAVTKQEFAILAASLLDRQPLSATAYAERVTLAERAAYERARGFPIMERAVSGLRPAGRRFTYYPMTYGVSELGDEQPLGIDVGTDPVRAAAMRRARDTGRAAMTSAVPLIRGEGEGVVAFLPIFDPDRPMGNVTARRRALQGFVAGVFRARDLMAAAVAAAPEDADVQMREDGRMVFGTSSQLEGASSASFALGDRNFLLVLWDPARPSLVVPAIIAGSGLLLAAMVAALLAGWARRERYALELVGQRMAERDAAETQRRESEHHYRLLAENSTDMITVQDRNGNITYASPSCETLLGWKPEQLVGRNIREFMHPGDKERLRAFADELLRSREVMALECRLSRSDGSYTWIEATSKAVAEPGSGEVAEIQASARDITERMAMQAELERLADQDPLTGLRNRRRFEEDLDAELRRARREQAGGALAMLDLDYFKRVNDTLGHPTGDAVLQEIADVLRSRLRESDILARLGGDEFAIILPRTREPEARLVGAAIRDAIREHVPERPGAPPMTASIGIALFDADPRATVTTVMAEADLAMYAAKDAGRDGLHVFDFQRDRTHEE